MYKTFKVYVDGGYLEKRLNEFPEYKLFSIMLIKDSRGDYFQIVMEKI